MSQHGQLNQGTAELLGLCFGWPLQPAYVKNQQKPLGPVVTTKTMGLCHCSHELTGFFHGHVGFAKNK